MFASILRYVPFLLFIAAFIGPPPASARSDMASEQVAIELGKRLDALQGLLDAVRDAKGEPLRQVAMQRHWQGMQDYMAASLKLAVPDPAAAQGCHVVGSAWSALSFPGQIRSDDYLKGMQARMGRMREELLGVHGAADADALNAALRAHWKNNYEFLQTMRGLGWMFTGWTPAPPGDQAMADPQSEGAKLTRNYCTICHAIPQARLHTPAEWASVMATMTRHMALSDSGIPVCVQMPSAAETQAIGDYLSGYAR